MYERNVISFTSHIVKVKLKYKDVINLTKKLYIPHS